MSHVRIAANRSRPASAIEPPLCPTGQHARSLRDWSPQERVDVIATNLTFGGMEEDGIKANVLAEFHTRDAADLFLVLDHLLPEYEILLAQIAKTRAKLKAQLMEALTR